MVVVRAEFADHISTGKTCGRVYARVVEGCGGAGGALFVERERTKCGAASRGCRAVERAGRADAGRWDGTRARAGDAGRDWLAGDGCVGRAALFRVCDWRQLAGGGGGELGFGGGGVGGCAGGC